MNRFTHQFLRPGQPEQILRQTHCQMSSKQKPEHLSPFNKFYLNIRKSTIPKKQDSQKQSTDTTSNKQDMVEYLKKTMTITKSLKKTHGGNNVFNLEDIKSEQQFIERYQNDPIFKFRVERLMKDVQKRAIKSPKLMRVILDQRQLNKQGQIQQTQQNMRVTFNQQKVQTDVLLKKYIAVYRSLIAQAFFSTKSGYKGNNS